MESKMPSVSMGRCSACWIWCWCPRVVPAWCSVSDFSFGGCREAGSAGGACCWAGCQGPGEKLQCPQQEGIQPRGFKIDVLWMFPTETTVHLCCCLEMSGNWDTLSSRPSKQYLVLWSLIPRLEWKKWPVRNRGWAKELCSLWLSQLLLAQCPIAVFSI